MKRKAVLCRVRVDEWNGGAPPIGLSVYALRRGRWLFLTSGKCKRVNGSRVQIVEEYDAPPAGLALVFEQIRRMFHLSH